MMMEGGGHGGAAVPPPLLYFSGGRIDAFAPEEDIYWGNESEWLQDHRHPPPPPKKVGIIGEEMKKTLSSGLLEGPLGAVQMGLYMSIQKDPVVILTYSPLPRIFVRHSVVWV
jgi:catalase (peroxidase I)